MAKVVMAHSTSPMAASRALTTAPSSRWESAGTDSSAGSVTVTPQPLLPRVQDVSRQRGLLRRRVTATTPSSGGHLALTSMTIEVQAQLVVWLVGGDYTQHAGSLPQHQVIPQPAREIRTMADISISLMAPRKFRVQVREGDRETTHQVTVPDRLGDGPELRDDDLERVVRESFRFLLERERATSILAQFSLSDVSRYFPEYPDELARRLS
jgi:hypothetical protein